MTFRSKPTSVVVLVDSELNRWLERQKPVLDADTARKLARAAKSDFTWAAEDSMFDAGVMGRFASLRREDSVARRRRGAWAFFLSIVVALISTPLAVAVLTAIFPAGVVL